MNGTSYNPNILETWPCIVPPAQAMSQLDAFEMHFYFHRLMVLEYYVQKGWCRLRPTIIAVFAAGTFSNY